MKYYIPISCFLIFSTGCSIYSNNLEQNYSTSWSSAIEKKFTKTFLSQEVGSNTSRESLSVVEMEQLAYSGDLSIQFELAQLYIQENLEHYNPEKAFFWCEQAAQKDYPAATFMMSYLYREGLGVPQSRKNSLRWLKKAAKLEVTEAQYLLGYAYENQKDVKRNYSRAIGLYRLAADKKHRGAQYALARMYYMGQAIAVNYQKAFDLFVQSAYSGHSSSQHYLGAMYFNEQHADIDLSGVPSKYQDLLRKTGLDTSNSNYTNNQIAYLWFSLANEAGEETSLEMMELIEPNIDLLKTHKILDIWKQELEV